MISQIEFPDWFSWTVPLLLLVGIVSVGRFDPPQTRGPAEILSETRTLILQRRWAEALTETNRLLELFPKSHVYLEQAARLSAELDQPREEAEYLERFLVVAPDPGEACPEVTHAYWRANQKQKMLDASSRCLSLEPRNSDFKFDFALANERAGNAAEALSLYEEGQRLFPGYTDFKIGHARVLLHTGRAAEAFDEITQTLQAHPGVADAQLVAALAAERLGLSEKAREILKDALRLHPTNKELIEANVRLQIPDNSK